MNDCFIHAKQKIIESIEEGVRIFSKDKKTCLSTDWCKQGIGFALYQQHCNCQSGIPFCCPTGWKLVFANNRFTHNAEQRYAPIEGEALAIAHALDKSRHFVLGCKDLTVATDHKPLLKTFGDRQLQDIKNPRLFNLKEKTLPYFFKIIHIPGKKNLTADVISRYPTGDSNPEIMFLQDDFDDSKESDIDELLTANAISSLAAVTEISTLAAVKAVTWLDVQTATSGDPIMMSLLHTIIEGFPSEKKELPVEIQGYFPFREDLSVVDGVVMYGDRIVIPPVQREQILETLHSAHQGTSSMTSRALSSVFWPGITASIQRKRQECTPCEQIAPSQPNPPPSPTTDPVYPFQHVCTDYFKHIGRNYLVLVDRYSGWPAVYRLSGGSAALIKKLREIFVTFGIPEQLASDGGPEFAAEATNAFLKDWGVQWRLSSVAYPHSNCRAEVGVKTVKRMIMENTDSSGDIDIPKFQRAMLQYRNTPASLDKHSPAEIVFGRQIRDFIPVKMGKYIPCSTWVETSRDREAAFRQRHAKEIEVLSKNTRSLPPLKVGDHVRIQNQVGNKPLRWDKTGVVIEVRQFDQYGIKIHGSGRVTLRNRKFLRKYIPFDQSRRQILPNSLYQPRSIGNITPMNTLPTHLQGSDLHTPETICEEQQDSGTDKLVQTASSGDPPPTSTDDLTMVGSDHALPNPSETNTTSEVHHQADSDLDTVPTGDKELTPRPRTRPQRHRALPVRFQDFEMKR